MTLEARGVRRWIGAAVLKSWWITEINHGAIDGPTAWKRHKGLLEKLGAEDDEFFDEACSVGNLERRELAVLCREGATLAEISAWCFSHQNSSIRVWNSLMMISGPPEALFTLARHFPASETIPRPLGRVADMVRGADETWIHTAEVLVRKHGKLPCGELIALVNSVVAVPVSVFNPREGCRCLGVHAEGCAAPSLREDRTHL